MRTVEPREDMIRNGIAEMVGTFILVFAGTSAVVASALNLPIAGPQYNSLAIGLVFGLVLSALVAALGHVSGAHFNPAVTLGLYSVKKFPAKFLGSYLGGQLLGAILASVAVWLTFGGPARDAASLGATFPATGVPDWRAFLMEIFITFILVFVIFGVATDPRAKMPTASLAIGFALAVAVLVGGPISGGSANPARTLGPMIVSGKFTGVWLYIIGPVIGGIAAAMLYDRLLRWTRPPAPEEETTVIGQEE